MADCVASVGVQLCNSDGFGFHDDSALPCALSSVLSWPSIAMSAHDVFSCWFRRCSRAMNLFDPWFPFVAASLFTFLLFVSSVPSAPSLLNATPASTLFM
ncbi:hypothetical protein H2248_011776 [Termitomyces sp. 'cryptogamus']|nr:hypothetical protein H2248_011776 [Termitomyces sp. 'cryptogamus']